MSRSNRASFPATVSFSLLLILVQLSWEEVSGVLSPLSCFTCNTDYSKEVSEAACKNPAEYPAFQAQLCSYSVIRNVTTEWNLPSQAVTLYTQEQMERNNVFTCRKQVRPLPDGSGKSVLRWCEYNSKDMINELNSLNYKRTGNYDSVCIPAGGNLNTGEKPDQTACYCSKDGCNAGSNLGSNMLISIISTLSLVILSYH